MLLANRLLLRSLNIKTSSFGALKNLSRPAYQVNFSRPFFCNGSSVSLLSSLWCPRQLSCEALQNNRPLGQQPQTPLSEDIKGKILLASPVDSDDSSAVVLESSGGQVRWSDIWRYLKQDWLLLLAVSMTAIATAFINISTPRVIGKLANLLTTAMSSSSGAAVSWSSVLVQLRQPALLLMALFGAQGVLTFVYISLVSVLGENVSFRLRSDLFTSLINQEMAFFDTKRTGELVNRLSDDVAEFKHSLKICVSQGLKSATQIIGSVVQLLTTSYVLTSYLLLAAPIMYGLGNIYGGYLRYLSKKAKEAEAHSSAIAAEAFSNIRTVRSFAGEEYEIDHYEESLRKAASAQEKLGFHIGIFQGFTNFSIGSMIVFVLYLGGTMVARETMTGGDLMSYLLSIQNTQKSLSSLSVLFAQAIKAFGSFSRIQEYLDRDPAIPTKGGLIIKDLNGDIQFKNVKFAYPTRPDVEVFEDFNLSIPAGRILALCGASGGGKSSIAALVERFYEVNGGSITVDGVDIKELDPKWLRQNIGFIHQEPILFAGTILENIRYGCPNASMEEVKRAAKDANAAEFIESLPDKYNSVVGERGVTLSGGQRQRIAIARALLKNPKILIFDEATSALDAESERIVQDALNRLMQGRTVVLIAHRLSTIQDAHQIVVLAKGGKILESGSHYELMHKRGAYYNLYTSANRTGN